MPAKARSKRCADDTFFQPINLFSKLIDVRTRFSPAEIAAVGCRADVFGYGGSHRCELVAIHDLIPDTDQALHRCVVVENFIRRNEDMSCADLIHDDAFCAAHVVEADEMEAAAGFNRFGHFASRQQRDDIGEYRRQFGALAPAQCATFKRRLAFGVGERHFGEV